MPASFSTNLMPDAPVADLIEMAVLAEQLGAARCWVYDEGLATRDVYVALTAIAANTTTMPIGPGITNPFVRHPGATATAIATLDELSGGRTFLGIGAGGGLTLDPLGIERTRPLTAVREMIENLRALFGGFRVDHQGHSFSFHNARLDYGRSDIQIMMAGRGPKMTALGGEIADGFTLGYIHKTLLGDHVRSLREAATSRPFLITYSTAIATDEAEFEAAREQLTFRLVDSPQHVKDLIELTPEDTEQIRSSLAEGGPKLAARHVKDDWIRAFVIAGTPAECGAELHQLLDDNQIDEFQLPVLGDGRGADLIERTAAMFNQSNA